MIIATVERIQAVLGLSLREAQVCQLIHTHSAEEIGLRLGISESTVKTHIRHIKNKLQVHSKRAVVQRMQHLGLL